MTQPEDSMTWDELQQYKSSIKLSILICSLEDRTISFENLLSQLRDQIGDRSDIEVLVEKDSGEMSIGAKRNKLLERSSGDYICYIDDDDTIEDNYIEEIMDAIELTPDVVGIKGNYYVGGDYQGMFIHSHRFKDWENKNNYTYLRCPNHLNPVKRSIAMQVKFPDTSFGEDMIYSKGISELIVSEVMIGIPIYNYMAGGK